MNPNAPGTPRMALMVSKDFNTQADVLADGSWVVKQRRYRCMYTPDVAKKGKKWHDGYLAFHHMNSKAILYDEQMIQLDECFHRIRQPGIPGLRDIPKTFVFADETLIELERHLVHTGEMTYQDERVRSIFTYDE